MDNSWVKNDKKPASNKIIKTKVTLSAIIILMGLVLTLCLNGLGDNATQYQSEGIVIDFGDYKTVWYEADFHMESDPKVLLQNACDENEFPVVFDASGTLTSVNGVANDSEHKWNLWYIAKGKSDYVRSDSYNIDPSKNKVTTWAYCADGASPTVALDASGTSVYGYPQANRVVTLSPVSTELVCSVNGINTIVGTDMYSNYPEKINKGHDNKSIAIVGTYTDPSYESIIHTNPDMVICDGSQYNHIQMNKTLRNSNINSILIYEGESIKTILDNIFLVGQAIHYNMAMEVTEHDLEDALNTLTTMVTGHTVHKVMTALSTDPAPYVAGDATYFSDIVEQMNGKNIYEYLTGWVHINSEYIGPKGDSKNDPEIIIVLSSDPSYHATESDYNSIINSLPDNWKNTTAYQNGEIYIMFDSLAEMAQRSGPRFAQLSELVARIICPDAFTDGITVPKYIGDEYVSYLTITKYLGFGDA